MKKSLILIMWFVFYAEGALANPGAWIPHFKSISSIFIEGDDNGRALIQLEGGIPPEYIPEGCRDGADSTYNTVFLNTEKGKAIYSMALSAYLAGKSVKIAVSCTGSRPLITHIWLR